MHKQHRVSWAWEVRPHLALTDLVHSHHSPPFSKWELEALSGAICLILPPNQEKLVLFLFYRPSYFPRS